MTPLLEVRNVSLSFGGVQAANDVNVTLNKGETFAIIGQNGAGKSTFLNICSGYLKPGHGQILFQGKNITGVPPRRITRMGIARAFQHPQLFQLRRVLDNMIFAIACNSGSFWHPKRMLKNAETVQKAWDLLSLCRLDGVATQTVSELSEGARKLLDVAVALALEPKLLLLDEPTSGVSSGDKHRVMKTLVEALERKNITSVFVEHDMDIVEGFADSVGVWANGQIIFRGSMQDAKSDPEVSKLVL